MKKIKLYITTFLVVVLFAVGCDKGFDDINTDKVSYTSLDPAYILNSSIINVTSRGGRAYLGQPHTIIQWIICPFGSSLQGANYNQWSSFQDQPWSSYYNSALIRIIDVLNKTEEDKGNIYHAARIWKAYIFQQLTDAYGDIPYFEAGLGFTGQLMMPVYDTQSKIYDDLLEELDEASAALDAGKGRIAGELLYGGDVDKWKKFGYSLLLRTAMRLSKVNPGKAEEYVKKAVAGGLMESNDDNAWIRHTPEYANSMGTEISGAEKGNYYITEAFVDFLKNTNDPRLGPLTHRYIGAASLGDQTEAVRTKNPADQIGQPIGHNDASLGAYARSIGLAGLHDYSQIDWNLFFINTSPEFHCTYGQTQLLLAEAIVRNWVTGDASTAYENAVRANMALFTLFNSAATVPAADINTYVAARPLDMSDPNTSLEQIHSEFWVGSFPNGTEAWANWRRTGYPVLPPNLYSGSQIPAGEFIRRHRYPEREEITNKANLQQAVSNQFGAAGEQMHFRVWWDVE